MRMRSILALPLFALTATTVSAQDNATCRNGLFPSDPPFALADVNGSEPAYFHDDMKGCPWSGDACQQSAFVTPGDTVIISKILKGMACAFYPSEGGGTAGWIETKRLNLLKIETNPKLSAWLGKWSSEGNPQLEFTKALGALRVRGKAFWPGPPGTTNYPSIHEGAIGGTVERTGHRGSYAGEHWCEVKFTLLGDFLIAGDNARCGGANVSFSAVYRRVRD